MAKPYKKKEKTVKIGKYRIKTGTLCIVGLVLILTISSAGFVASNIAGNREDEVVQGIQARIIVDFGNFTQYSEIVTLQDERTAEAAFKQAVNMTTEISQGVTRASSISAGNWSKAKNETHAWNFYINARLTFTGLSQYQVRHGDLLELRLEKKLF